VDTLVSDGLPRRPGLQGCGPECRTPGSWKEGRWPRNHAWLVYLIEGIGARGSW